MAKKRIRRSNEQLLQDNGLIFINTNIFLDLYRMDAAAPSMKWLSQLENNLNRIISSDQIEMEFKKNRQKVILDTLKQFKAPKWDSLQVPPILHDSQAIRTIETHKKGIKKQVLNVNREIINYLKTPTKFR